MGLLAGTRLRAYEITALIGAGGMGEVYRARDTRLKRDVAIKVLPEAFSNDPERLARFQREAELLATLNHPNIAQIYGLEDRALILELVEGPTLADRIAQGPIPIDEALPIARQIAEALEAAHERGVIHRDLKPANIKLTPDGTVKVLDFGLAKALEPASPLRADLSNSPTITSPAMTMGGVILGTAAYMSPEQAKGRPADKRSDIWAFGCVLFEMLTGRRAFDGDDVTETLAAIIKSDPDWKLLPSGVPPSVRRLLQRCLEKARARRLADIADARLEIEDTALQEDTSSPVNRNRLFPTAVLSLVAVILAVLIGLAASAMWVTPVRPTPPRRFLLLDPRTPAADLFIGSSASNVNLAISPNGRYVAYVSSGQVLHVRNLDQLHPMPMAHLGSVRTPFFSPDSNWVAYVAGGNNELKKVRVSGGPPVTIAQTQGDVRSGSWAQDGRIFFATIDTGVWAVPNEGGTPMQIVKPTGTNPERFTTPQLLPDGRRLLVSVARGGGASTAYSVASYDLQTHERTIVIDGGSNGQYLPTGHLIFSKGSTVFAARAGSRGQQVGGEEVPILENLQTGAGGLIYLAAANDGTLVYLPGDSTGGASRTLVWIDRAGRETPLDLPPRPYETPRISPDGTKILVALSDSAMPNLFLHELRGNPWIRLTFTKTADLRPTWGHDGRYVYFTSQSEGRGVYRTTVDGSGNIERMTLLSGDGAASSTSPDGKVMLYSTFDPNSGRDIWTLDTLTRRSAPLVAEPGAQGNSVVSPNGKWVAYSDETEGYIFVRPFPDVSRGRWQVSPPNSKWPLWSRDGRELFFVSGSPRSLMSAAVDVNSETFKWSAPVTVVAAPYARFEGNTGPRNYDVASDGRFLAVKEPVSATRQSLIVVENWFEELKQRVPTN